MTKDQTHHLLYESWYFAIDEAISLVRSRCGGLGAAQAEDVVADVGARLGALFDGWRSDGPFRTYLTRTLEREAWASARRDARTAPLHEGPVSEVDEGAEQEWEMSPRRAQALRRFIWYLYGSPDNPSRIRSDKALVDFIALSARLERRPFAALVRDLQPRPGAWHAGNGEEDRKWWRGRAQMAQRRVQQALERPETRAVYERILLELEREDAHEGRRGR